MNGIFAIEKPSGITSSQFLSQVQKLFMKSKIFQHEIGEQIRERTEQYKRETGGRLPSRKMLRKSSKIKMGHGGTLDPLASGVLVIGIGKGTKQLSQYLHGTVKCYEAEALLGASTTSGDCEPNGEIISLNSVNFLKSLTNTDSIIDDLTQKFKGHLKQTPPIFAALKMNGKPLHEYAREGLPLPKPIEPRELEISELVINKEDFLSTSHNYKFLPITDSLLEDLTKLEENNANNGTPLFYSKEYCESHNLPIDKDNKPKDTHPITREEAEHIMKLSTSYRAPLLHFIAKVSSGTYIRSLITDMGKSLGTSAYMVKLIRLSQKDWDLTKNNVFKLENFVDVEESIWSKVLKKVLDEGPSVDIQREIETLTLESKEKEQVEQEGCPDTKKHSIEIEEDIEHPDKKRKDI
ncbi:related to tRNA pseudouridine synthase 4 [Saccharomycodes ludwigii]|uniref:tRNA pseudouridine(55) synthase n=1 Tax=Saccharomycodes ludwigii TaxID=36035 RepID=A0A376B5A1_9ASCO|nr:hypothetical protein SCDLUD_005046 [Saccharomycodes ludwigii]KAH3898722.1 hypothetical protein SCDLUD_005046 [Saccharomycodes ludwigii]SSD59821.1 related to tRNA pseudouridine synthase 4 [Saccharomycodes ludwigii]